MEIKNTQNPREAAYFVLLASSREEIFVGDALRLWKQRCQPSDQDYHLAREIAYGVTRMAMALDHLATQLTDKQKLSLKLKEKLLFRMALYQYIYMERIPLYALVDETVKIAKKHCHETFVKFLNGCLRSLEETELELPKGETVPELGIRYSYPAYYVQELVQNYGLEKAKEIMESGNSASPTLFRIRPQSTQSLEVKEGVELLTGTRCPMGVVKDSSLVPEIAASPDYYIQNATPAELIAILAQDLPEPKRILDLCASPGGKLIAVHDHFPEAELFANDVSSDKLQPLSDNCAKYGVSATLSCYRGEQFPIDETFDLVILDVPCSNSGVLNKRPEARWRLSHKTMEHLEEIQLGLVKHSLELVAQGGEVWYITCSLLKRENNRLIKKICEEFPVEVRMQETILPNEDGWDGGFACALRKLA
jgi:16S rRNA (cytosine967-C5)-methyltransferase